MIRCPRALIEQLLQALTNPNIVFLLLTIGVQALLIELSSPGGWVAGFIGVVCLALGVYGSGHPAGQLVRLIFLATAFVLFILDIKAPTHGALTTAGWPPSSSEPWCCSTRLGHPAFQRVSIPLVVGMGSLTAALFFVVLTFAIRAQRRPVEVGVEALVGRIGEVRGVWRRRAWSRSQESCGQPKSRPARRPSSPAAGSR